VKNLLKQGCQGFYSSSFENYRDAYWSRIGTKLCRAVTLQELSLTSLD